MIVLAATGTAVGSTRAEDAEAALRAIVQSETRFYERGEEAGARAAFLEFLADDGIVFQPGPLNGKKAWGARSEEGLSLKWQPVFAAMARSGNLGFTTGPAEWRKRKEDEKPFGYGQFISIWKKQKDGSWKVAVDVGSEVPGPQKHDAPPELSFSGQPAPGKTSRAAATPKLREAEAWFDETAAADSTAAVIGSSAKDIRVQRDGAFPAVTREAAGLMLSVGEREIVPEAVGRRPEPGRRSCLSLRELHAREYAENRARPLPADLAGGGRGGLEATA